MRRVSIWALTGLGLLMAGCDISPAPQNVPVTTATPPSAPTCPATIVVQPHDNVYSVSQRCGLSVRELIETNHLQPPYVLVPGSTLLMPGRSGEIVVGKGDTLRGLAIKNHVDFNALAAANHKTAPYVVRVGEHLRLPGSFAAPQSAGSRSSAVEVQPLPPPPKPKAVTTASASVPQQALPPPVAAAPSAPAAAAAAAAPPPPSAPLPTAIKGFVWPIKGELLVGFGPQAAKGQNNDGINIAAAKGTPIHAVEAGVVAYVGNELKGFGNLVLIKHADGWVSAYAHADQVEVKKGQSITKGQEIGTVGQTGSVSQPQLHFELRRQGEAVDPETYLPS